jgi:NADPH:quinone reductase-like Zn-dependent oxidoreductase
MKAYKYPVGGSIEDLELIEIDTPRPAAGQVLVRMRAASLNFRDLLVVSGKYPRAQQDTIIPLSDGAGEVVELGRDVTGFAVGDRVLPVFFQSWLRGPMLPGDTASALGGSIDGVAAQYRVFEAERIVHFAPHLSFVEASTLPCAGLTAWNGLNGPVPISSADTVLTLGTGGVSIFAMQLARASGARVVITSSSDAKLERARDLGANSIVNYRSDPEWDVSVRALTQGRGVDHVIETGGGGTMQRSISCTRRGGWVHVIGLVAPGTIDTVHVLLSGVILRGTEVGSLEMLKALNRAVDNARLHPVVDRVYEFSALPAALRDLAAGEHFGKLAITIE